MTIMESAMAEVSAEKEPLLGFSEEKLLKILRNMLLYRRFEEKAEEAYAIGGRVHRPPSGRRLRHLGLSGTHPGSGQGSGCQAGHG